MVSFQIDKKTSCKKIALVLPAFNEEGVIEAALTNVVKGMELFPQHDFSLFLIDDGSTDNTYAEMLKFGTQHCLKMFPYRHKENVGIAQAIKRAYRHVVTTDNDVVIKTDLDSDFDQSVVLRMLVPYAETGERIVAGVRWREITCGENPYEVERREDMLRILDAELGITELDPPSAGSPLYTKDHLAELLNHPMVAEYDKRWGFEVLLHLLSASIGRVPPVVHIENGSYDPARRPSQKVDAQYDAYIEIVANLKGKSPRELSRFYTKSCTLRR